MVDEYNKTSILYYTESKFVNLWVYLQNLTSGTTQPILNILSPEECYIIPELHRIYFIVIYNILNVKQQNFLEKLDDVLVCQRIDLLYA